MYRDEHGYTLVELLIVIGILGITAVVAIPNFSTTNPAKLELAAEEFAQAIRYARSEAIRTGEPRGVHQLFVAKKVSVISLDTMTSPWSLVYDVYHPVSKKLYTIDLTSHPFAQADTISQTSAFNGSCNNDGDIYFDSNGVPRCVNPETTLVEQLNVKFTLGDHKRLVILHGITGRVTVQ